MSDPAKPDNPITQPPLPQQGLVTFIGELNILARHVTAYPEGHPVIDAAARKALHALEELLTEQETVTLGVAKEELLVDAQVLEPRTPASRHYARLLFAHGVAALSIRQGLGSDELIRFTQLIRLKPAQLSEQGGLARVLAETGGKSIEVHLVDYQSFHATDQEQVRPPTDGAAPEDSAKLWKAFVHGLIDGTLDPTGRYIVTTAEMDPELLAKMGNEQYAELPEGMEGSYSRAMEAFLGQMDREDLEASYSQEALDKLSAFVRGLSPELRRQFFTGIGGSLADRRGVAEKVLKRFPDELILEILDDINAQKSYAPPVILELLQKLSGYAGGSSGAVTAGEKEQLSELVVGNGLRLIFREDSLQECLPEDYRETLQKLIATPKATSPAHPRLEDLQITQTHHNVEIQISAVIFQLLQGLTPGEEAQALEDNLREICTYFLEVGDFAALEEIYRRLAPDRTGEGLPHGVRLELLAWFSDREFTEEVLNGIQVWGKPKHDMIAGLMRRVGAPFIEPLLDRLAEETGMSARRYLMERLMEQGKAVRRGVIERLRDRRWYFVRNLVIILRNLGDPECVPVIRRLINYPNPKVQQEALKACLQLRDPQAGRLLLKNLASPDPELQLHAVQLAPLVGSPEVLKALLELLADGGTSDPDLELKGAVVRSLAELKNAAALPALERLLQTRSLLRSAMLGRLKAEIVRSLAKYPAAAAKPLLDRLAESGRGELAELAIQARSELVEVQG